MGRKKFITEVKRLTMERVRPFIDLSAKQLRAISDDGSEVIVPITWSKSTFGPRPWFKCPECGRRGSVLYTDRLICRFCADLVYPSDYDTPVVKQLRKAGAPLAEILSAQFEHSEKLERRQLEREGQKLIW